MGTLDVSHFITGEEERAPPRQGGVSGRVCYTDRKSDSKAEQADRPLVVG